MSVLGEKAWEKEVIASGMSQTMPYGWFEEHFIGGDMGTADEDFEVTEIPAYDHCGSGEHLYLLIEKRGRTTLDVQKVLEKIYGVKEADVGYAGKKDVHAITRQWFSVQTNETPEDDIAQIEAEGAFMCSVCRVTRISSVWGT